MGAVTDSDEETAASRAQRDRLAGLLAGRQPIERIEGEAEWLALVATAESEGVAPLLHRTFSEQAQLHVPATASAALEHSYRRSFRRMLSQVAIRRLVCGALEEQGIPVLLLKGAALAFSLYPDPATRPMLDLDLLIPPAHLATAAQLLPSLGFSFLSGSLAAELSRTRSHLVARHSPTHALLELHWELKLLGRHHRRATAAIWQGAQPAPFQPGASLMRPAHALPLLCAHAVLQHQRASLRHLWDIAALLGQIEGAEAQAAAAAAEEWGIGECTGLTVQRVGEWLGAKVAPELGEWAAGQGQRRSLQGRVSRTVLAAGGEALPSRDLLALLMGCSHQSWRRFLLPSSLVVRNVLGRSSPTRATIQDHVSLAGRRMRGLPAHCRQVWSFLSSPAAPSPDPASRAGGPQILKSDPEPPFSGTHVARGTED